MLIDALNPGRQQRMILEHQGDVPAHHGRQLHGRQPGLAGLAIEIQLGTPKVLRRQVGVNPVPHHRALPDEKHASAEQLAEGTGGCVGTPDRWQQVHPREFGELPRIDRIRLRAGLPDQLHPVLKGDHHPVPKGRQPALKPVPVERGFERNGERLRESREPLT